jgi:hypothetical protein
MQKETEDCMQNLIGKSCGWKLLGRPRQGWKDELKRDLGNVGCADMQWIEPN